MARGQSRSWPSRRGAALGTPVHTHTCTHTHTPTRTHTHTPRNGSPRCVPLRHGSGLGAARSEKRRLKLRHRPLFTFPMREEKLGSWRGYWEGQGRRAAWTRVGRGGRTCSLQSHAWCPPTAQAPLGPKTPHVSRGSGPHTRTTSEATRSGGRSTGLEDDTLRHPPPPPGRRAHRLPTREALERLLR